jgi:hypothetical protein
MSATYLASLTSRRDALALRLAELNSGDAGELANVRGEGEIDHGELIDRIHKQIKALNDEIDREVNRETWDFATRART